MATTRKGNDQKLAVGQNRDEADGDEETPLLRNYDNENSSRRSTKTQLFLCVCILGTELCERLTFFGTAANLVPYCEDVLKLQTPVPSQINLSFVGKMKIL